MKKNKKQLVEEATIVSKELMKVAITPNELWYDGLEQAAQLYMDNKDITGMVNVLSDLHETMNDQPWSENKKLEGFTEGLGKIGFISLRDVSFRHAFGKNLQDALFWLEQFRSSGRTVDLHQAWEIYQSVFKKIKNQIVSLKKLELDHVSPALTLAINLSLVVPGTYRPNATDILITSFSRNVHVIASKQRPRRISMMGSDGKRYQFLLKGHEDLRQDERVMQLFGLINACLNYDRITNDRGLNIVRYSVLPLSNNSGVIGWVENCDTINQLIKHYREENDIRLLTEMRLLQSKSRNFDKLPLLHKVDLFCQVLNETSGEDLAKMLWLKSQTSDVWIERRGNFTKSLAVMSMAGYILGLGDRHPSNLMIHRISGQVVHIDFGDCFEITANRSKYPEIIPFRLTRMLTNCMGIAGMQGTYRLTCERVIHLICFLFCFIWF
jgi:FKBP12-rapamycin complex-associated protein